MASTTSQIFNDNAKLLRAKASKHAIIGTLIAIAAVIIATIATTYLPDGTPITFQNMLNEQKTNEVLWILDTMPFVFAFWGQYTSSIMAYEAGAMVLDQTQELRTQTAALESQVAHSSTHDALTGLPNRILLADRLEQAINTASASGHNLAIVLLDLDGFKEINDTLGHFNGDRILKNVATRLEGPIQEPATLARLGGDEFAALLPKINDVAEVKDIARRIHKALEVPFVLDGLTLDVKTSIGAAVFPEHGNDADTLIKLADVAMYVAKDHKNDLVIYSPKLNKHSPQKLTLMGELRRAIEQDELVIHYQPSIYAATGELSGAEALVRWNHPDYGLMGPDEFVPLAERTGLTRELSMWVLNAALNQVSAWHQAGHKMDISINLSARTLLDVEFPHVIAGLLARHDVPGESVILEITETTIMADQERALEILSRLASMGIRISIDDFGTGYSSLAYLKKLPVSEIKIDKSFVLDMHTNENDAVIVHATVQLGKNLSLHVVAEGVETRESLNKLRELGADTLQGYYISPPLEAAKFSSWREDWEKNKNIKLYGEQVEAS
ncbi:MAG: EAL domain-containing protein [Gammaproteobacteria bacterium]|nr:EAL domain-containing protein [Gammaproteobacteria bacterium]